RLFQYCVGGDHLPWDQVLPDAEMLQRALRLRPPQFVGWYLHDTKAVGFSTNFGHEHTPSRVSAMAFVSGPALTAIVRLDHTERRGAGRDVRNQMLSTFKMAAVSARVFRQASASLARSIPYVGMISLSLGSQLLSVSSLAKHFSSTPIAMKAA